MCRRGLARYLAGRRARAEGRLRHSFQKCWRESSTMGRPYCELAWRCCAASLIAANLSACGVLPTASSVSRGTPSVQREDGQSENLPSASSVLLAQSQTARTEGDFPAAVSAIERALRIDPNNAVLWLEFSEVRMAEGDFQQAEALARKSASLAGDNHSTQTAATQLIVSALRAQGRVTGDQVD